MIRELNSPHLGMCFDIGHATVEGGLSWPIEARAVEPHLAAVFVKDFVWRKDHRGWREAWCHLGDGMVDPGYFEMLKASRFHGPVTQHHEYEMGDQKTMIAHMRRDREVLKAWLG